MPRSFQVSFERNLQVPMRDGTILYGDLYRPAVPGRYPVILMRSPYNKAEGVVAPTAFGLRAAGEGYALFVQDTRGRWASGGEFDAFHHERDDGFDTLMWLHEQHWSNGRVGMFGQSYVGLTQWQAAISGGPGLQAIVPAVTAADYHEGWAYQGGAFELNFNLSWTLTFLATDTLERRRETDPEYARKRDEIVSRIDRLDEDFARLPLAGDPLLQGLAPYYDDWLAHPEADAFWDSLKVANHYDELDVAALNVGGWYDIFLGGTLTNFMGMRAGAKTPEARASQHLLIGPWAHASPVVFGPVGEVDFGTRSTWGDLDMEGIHLRWYDRWLRDIDNGVDTDPPVKIFVMGANVWREEHEWPLARTRYVEYFLHSGGRANTLNGDGALSPEEPADERPDSYLYDPLDPVPTVGGGLCCNFIWSRGGAYDQRAVEARSDVLVYTTPPLEQPLEVTGPITLRLYAASSAVDTDFTAKLVDVCPCGCARNLTDGIIRARYRRSVREATMLTPGEVEAYDIDLWATSNVFLAGHRIRLEVSSSNFPRFDRNLNTGEQQATATEMVPAMQTVHHDRAHPSRLVLPLIE